MGIRAACTRPQGPPSRPGTAARRLGPRGRGSQEAAPPRAAAGSRPGRPRGRRVRVTRTPRRDPRSPPGRPCGAVPRPHRSRGGRQGPQVSATEQHDAPAPRAGAPALHEGRAGHSRAVRKVGAGPCRPGDATANRARPGDRPGGRVRACLGGTLGTAHGDGAAQRLRAGRDGAAEDRGPLAAGQYPEYARRSERGIGEQGTPGRRDGERVREAHTRRRPRALTAGQRPAGVRRPRARTSRIRTPPRRPALAGEFTRPHASARPMQPARETPMDAVHAVGPALTRRRSLQGGRGGHRRAAVSVRVRGV